MKIAIFTVNDCGGEIAGRIKENIEDSTIVSLKRDGKNSAKDKIKRYFYSYEGLVFISAIGIAVRFISPYVKSKWTDPAVVSVDSAARFVISLLSGHEGGANMLAYRIAAILCAEPVVTTAGESNKHIIIGIGCRAGASSEDITGAVIKALKENNIGLNDIRLASTTDLKKTESGLIKACQILNIPLVFRTKKEIAGCQGIQTPSKAVSRHLGIDGVCEPCALLSGRRTQLIVPKTIYNHVALAFAKEDCP